MTTPGPLLITHRMVVRFSDCDPLGHVNNARYLTYLEQARIELWRRQGVKDLGSRFRENDSRSFQTKTDSGNRFPVAGGPETDSRNRFSKDEGFILARMEIDFVAPAYDGDVLDVKLTLDAVGRKSMTYGYEITDVTTGEVVASAKSVVVWYDYATNQSVVLTDEKKVLLSKPVPGTSTEQYPAPRHST